MMVTVQTPGKQQQQQQQQDNPIQFGVGRVLPRGLQTYVTFCKIQEKSDQTLWLFVTFPKMYLPKVWYDISPPREIWSFHGIHILHDFRRENSIFMHF